jgi:hypothetical protein
MSDPVSTMDVEDVLSSIRRLVSEEAKGAGHAGESAAGISSAGLHEEAENTASDALSELVQAVEGGADLSLGDREPEDSDDALNSETDYESDPQVSFRHQAANSTRRNDDKKLVLTAALRVADPEPLEQAPRSFGLASQIADQEGADDSEATGSGGATGPSDTLYSYPHLRPVEDLQDETAQPDARPETERAQSEKPAPFDYAPEDTLFDRAKHAMEAVKDGRVARNNLASTIARPRPETVSPLRAVAAAVDDQDGPETGDRDGKAIDVTAMSDANQDDTVETADISPTSPFRAAGGAFEQTEPDTAGTTTIDELDEDEPSTINFAEADESILDEDTLRDLVSDMVREELQGELGDRITRNVRKLVRREIQRAMASREFE